MRLSMARGVLGLLALAFCAAASTPVPSFTPPQVFKNVNLLRTYDLSKPYIKETIAAIVENTSQQPQTEYFLPVPTAALPLISSIEAKDKKGDLGELEVNLLPVDDERPTQFYRIRFSKPLPPSETYTIQVTLVLTNVLTPVPASIAQTEQQFLQLTIPRYAVSAYPIEKQKTKIKCPSADIPEYTKFGNLSDGSPDASKSGSIITYGPYGPPPPASSAAEAESATESAEGKSEPVKSGASEPDTITVRYEYTSPIIHATKVERDIEVSHWGGNLATEERYWLTNAGAKLKDNFSRVTWTSRSYYNYPTAAIKVLTYPLHLGSSDVYYTDEIGNVTTSRFRSNAREAHLELKPRYPVFGGWNYTFTVGWNHDLKNYLKTKVVGGEEYVLKVPFMQGPTDPITYESFELRVILPEGATNIQYHSSIPASETRYLHQTYMDTLGRPTLKLTTKNLVDEIRGKDIIVTYTYPATAALRKPLTISAGFLTIFTLSWLLSRVDVRIGK